MNILFLVKLKVGRRSFFGRDKKCKVRLHSRILSCYEGLKKALLLRNLKLFLHSLLDPLTKKYSRVWSSMINFVNKVQYMSEESSCQQEEPLITNYSFQGKMCQECYAMLSCWPCRYLKVPLMVLFHKIFRLTFNRQPSCPKKCPDH